MVRVPAVAVVLLLLSAAASTVSRAQENPGQAAYTRICQACHGPEGRGGAGPSLVPLDKEYEEVLAIVREGGGQMPPISAERLSDDDVKHVVEYLKSLKSAK